jgi:hypothetical protein
MATCRQATASQGIRVATEIADIMTARLATATWHMHQAGMTEVRGTAGVHSEVGHGRLRDSFARCDAAPSVHRRRGVRRRVGTGYIRCQADFSAKACV